MLIPMLHGKKVTMRDRCFIGKGKRISDYGLDALANIEDWCNNLPRKLSGYKTPNELFEAKLDEIYAIL